MYLLTRASAQFTANRICQKTRGIPFADWHSAAHMRRGLLARENSIHTVRCCRLYSKVARDCSGAFNAILLIYMVFCERKFIFLSRLTTLLHPLPSRCLPNFSFHWSRRGSALQRYFMKVQELLKEDLVLEYNIPAFACIKKNPIKTFPPTR